MVLHTCRSPPLPEKVGWLARHQRKEVIIEIDEFFRESLDFVHEHLDGCAIESGQTLGRNDILMKYDVNNVAVYPCRNLAFTGNDKKNILHKRHTLFNASQQIRQCPPIAITLGESSFPDTIDIVFLPLGILSIDVCYYDVHVFMPTKLHLFPHFTIPITLKYYFFMLYNA